MTAQRGPRLLLKTARCHALDGGVLGEKLQNESVTEKTCREGSRERMGTPLWALPGLHTFKSPIFLPAKK